MERNQDSQLSPKPENIVTESNTFPAGDKVLAPNGCSEVVECSTSPIVNDSGYSSDVELFESPISHLTSVEESISLEEYKTQLDDALRDYFVTNNLIELLLCIDNMGEPLYNYEAVMRAISLSLDRGDREREMVSRFFAEAHGRELSPFAFEKGFEMCFERISDLQLDCPNVKEILSKFLARAIVDEVFPPRVLDNIALQAHGSDVLKKAESLLNQPHSIELMEHVWGASAATLEDVHVTKSHIRDAIEEYYSSLDKKECLRCLVELQSAPYMHEFVKRTIDIAMDGDNRRQQHAIDILEAAMNNKVVSHHQLILGLRRVHQGLADLVLDVPFARDILESIETALIEKNLLSKTDLPVEE